MLEELDLLLNRKVYCAVAQRMFEVHPNTFATLIPLLHENGTPAREEEFPMMGDVWWMLRPQTRAFAEPGRLLQGRLQRSPHAGAPGKAVFQVDVASIEPVDPEEIVEVLEIPGDSMRRERDIVKTRFQVEHPPAEIVYARWRGDLYGPFRAEAERIPGRSGWRLVGLVPSRPDSLVTKIRAEAFAGGGPVEVRATISVDDKPVYQGGEAHDCVYRLILRDRLEAAIKASSETLVIEPDHAVVARAAKNLTTRRDRQTLRELMVKLEEGMAADPEEVRPEDANRIRELIGVLGANEEADRELARALVESGLLEERIREMLREAEERHILENSARLEKEISGRVAELRKEEEQTRSRIKQIIDKERAERLKDLEATTRARRAELAAEEKKLHEREAALEKRSKALESSMNEVARRIAKDGQEIVNQFLTMAPLLARFGLAPGGGAAGGGGAGESNAPAFELPPYVIAKRSPRPVADEVGFFERFRAHVAASGFEHRRIDLAAFHLSVKCSDLVVLGGLPGTGKSSLPRLYAEALLGDEHEAGRERHLHIGVSPSWLDMRDLLGHVNTLDHIFQPSESGLYPHLVRAMEEKARHGDDTGIYTVLLDEMNLSHVEHYFSGFVQALELPPGRREIRCFSPEVVSPSSAFAKWPVLNLPRSLRFVGTVNFDETTKQLSQRVLDRANLVRLDPRIPPDAREPRPAKPSGPPVTYRSYKAWLEGVHRHDAAATETLDAMKEPLAVLGCPMNPRRTTAMLRFVANAPAAVCTPVQALDLQIAQRLMPQIRGLFRPEARKAIEAVAKILESRSSDFPESLRALDEVRRSEGPGILFDEG